MKLFFFSQKKISPCQLHYFTRQLATLLNAGLPLLRGLQILEEQEANPFFKKVISRLIENIESGNTLSESLATFPALFSPLYLNMVHAGELGSMLGMTLERLALFQEKMQKIKNKIISILLYPTIVLITTLLMMTFLFMIIIPKFEAVFADVLQGQTLPPLTQIVLELSRCMRNYFLEIVSGIMLFFLMINIALRKKMVRRFFDRALLMIPFLGTLFQKHFIAQSFNTLGMLILHGVPILEAISVTQKISENRTMQAAMSMIHDSLQAGDSLMHPMKASGIFPPMVTSMVAVGEETGQLSAMLLQVATIYEQDVDNRTTQLLGLLEPCILLFLACFVGAIVLALFLPIISMMSELQAQ